MDPKDGPQNGPEDGPNPNPKVYVLALEAPSNYRAAPRTESSTSATETPSPFAPAQQPSTPATGTPPVGMAQESSTPATGPPPFASSGPRRRGRPRMYDTSRPILSPTPISAQPLVGSGDFPNVPPPTQPPSGGPQPPRGGPQPPSGCPQPPSGGSGGRQPPSGGRQPPSGGRQPPCGGRQPPSGSNENGPEFPGEGINLFTGGTFVPHVLIVNPGEDVSERIQSLYNEGSPRSIVVICGSGYISNATLRQTDCSGGRMTFEGRFQIVSLSGSFVSTELIGLDSGLSVGLSVSLARADGHLIGGMLAGVLVAASPIQIILGSFLPRGYKEPKQRKKKTAYKPHPPAATMGPMPSSSTPNVDHPIFEGNEQSHHAGGAVAGTSNDGVGSSSLSDLNIVDWDAMNLDSDMAGKSTTDMNVSPKGE